MKLFFIKTINKFLIKTKNKDLLNGGMCFVNIDKFEVIAKCLNIIFPTDIKCIFCGEELSENKLFSVCDKCEKELPYIANHTCKKCGCQMYSMSKICNECKTSNHKFKSNYSVFYYDGIVAKRIKQLKFQNKKYLSKTFSNFIVAKFLQQNIDVDFVIPVPLSLERLRQRGYNQSQLLCQSFIDNNILDVKTNILSRVKNTKSQTHLTKSDRKLNIKDAFKVEDKQQIKGKNILLVDDIYTTGSTLNECAIVLLKNGAKSVFAITLANANNEEGRID